jgi:fluoroquinolone resistance protein
MKKTTASRPAVSDVQAPHQCENLVDASLSETVSRALEQHLDIDGLRFMNDKLSGCSGGCLEFSGCAFEHCVFSDWEIKRLSFVDCVLEHCDLSGLRLENVTFQRVRITSCRLTGAELLKASLTNTRWEDCSADYLAFSECKCIHVYFNGCRLRESVWQDVVLKYTAFERCDFTSAQIRFVPMADIDMTTCVLDALQIDPRDLRGMRVTALQGLMFCSLLGLVIADAPPEQEASHNL